MRRCLSHRFIRLMEASRLMASCFVSNTSRYTSSTGLLPRVYFAPRPSLWAFSLFSILLVHPVYKVPSLHFKIYVTFIFCRLCSEAKGLIYVKQSTKTYLSQKTGAVKIYDCGFLLLLYYKRLISFRVCPFYVKVDAEHRTATLWLSGSVVSYYIGYDVLLQIFDLFLLQKFHGIYGFVILDHLKK